MTNLAQSQHIALLLGGWSSERDVSLISGQEINKALRAEGFQVTCIDVTRDAEKLCRALKECQPDVVFNGLHGIGGEDGLIQGVLEYLKLPYTHSNVFSSALAMNKSATKHLLAAHDIQSPKSITLDLHTLKEQPTLLPRPFVLKPTAEGSSVGLVIVTDETDLLGEIDTLLNITEKHPNLTQPHSWMIEEFIQGIELTVGVVRGKALAVTEIRYATQTFDYEAKYSAGVAEHIIPAPIPDDITKRALETAEKAHNILGCKGISRSDFRYDPSNMSENPLFFLEINTQPGFTPISLLPEQANFKGISYGALCRLLVEDAQCLG